jgi:hypothetical protein
MRKSLFATASFAVLACMGSWTARAASYIPVPPISGSTSMTVFGIDNSNELTGSYVDSAGVEHGFYGQLDGGFVSFDFIGKNTTGTEPRAITADGSIDGFAPGSGFAIGEEFFRTPDGTFKVFKHDSKPLDGVAQGISSLDVNAGDYFDASGVRVGYLGTNGKYTKDFNLHIKGWLQNSPRKITSDGVVAGYFIDKNNGEHGFIQNGKSVQVIDYPDAGAVLTVLEDLNGAGQASGQWDDSSGNPHAFVLDTASSKYTVLDPGDGSAFQQAWGISGKGLVALSTSNGVSYIYCPLKKSKCPSGGVEAKMRAIHVPAGSFLKYDRYGRTAHKVRSAESVIKHGAIQ